MTDTSRPFLGGSRKITSAFTPSEYNLGSISSAFPASNSAFLIPLISALCFASSMALSTISMPYTDFALPAAKRDMVPIPQ